MKSWSTELNTKILVKIERVVHLVFMLLGHCFCLTNSCRLTLLKNIFMARRSGKNSGRFLTSGKIIDILDFKKFEV